MNHHETTEPGQKALQINLDATKHGTFAEIGAGQEVARWFFRVGGAAGTVAKTISAYDKAVSDAIYGASDQYVSRQRLRQMLDYEYQLLLERLDASRGADTTFFVFADTVAARSYTRRDDSHGWLGVKFQAHPREEPSEVMIHARLFDEENVREQEALGLIGVNLIYGAFFHLDQPRALIASLLDQLTKSRIEIDMIQFSVPVFANVDNRLMSLQLVEQGLTEAVLFTVDGEVVQPSEALHKKPVLVERGTFRPVNNLHVDMLECARRQFLADSPQNQDAVVLMEITMRNLLDRNRVHSADFLARVEMVRTLGKMVMITSHGEFYHMVEYLRRTTKNAIGIAIGLPTLEEILSEKYYADLNGGILEAVGRMFQGPVKFYVYPRRGTEPGSVITIAQANVPDHLTHLVAHLRENHFIEDLRGIRTEYLDIHSSELLRAVRDGDPTWETQVPRSAADIIKARNYFSDNDRRPSGAGTRARANPGEIMPMRAARMNVCKRYSLAMALVACASLALGCGTVARSLVLKNPKVESILDEPQPDRTITHTGRVEYIGDDENRITVLYVTGTPYEMGYEHGRLLAGPVRETIHDVQLGANKFLPKAMRESKLLTKRDEKEIITEFLDRAWHLMARYAPPEDLEEMRGLAAGSGIPLDVIHRMHAIPDTGETSCSGLVAKGHATSDGHVYQLRILDYGANFNLQRRPLITVYRPTENANTYITIGWVGFVGAISGVNEKGVALSEMGFGNPPGETLAGTPMPFLLKNVLRYANSAEQGAAIIRAARRTNSYVYFLGDKHNNPVGMITSAQHCLAYQANDRDTLDIGGEILPQFRDVVYGGHYEKKQAQLVGEMQGKLDVRTIQDLARQIAMKSNLQAVIYDLTADKIWVANRKDNVRAADRPYVEFSLADAWKKSAEPATTPVAMAGPK